MQLSSDATTICRDRRVVAIVNNTLPYRTNRLPEHDSIDGTCKTLLSGSKPNRVRQSLPLKREGRMYQAPNVMHLGSNNIV
eukprot:scaffold158865_cov55-Attheya_sp.AAC.2